MLFDDFMETFIFIDKKTVSDGIGGVNTEYVDGAEFAASVKIDSSTQARIAEKDSKQSIYTCTTYKTVTLRYNDVIKRKKDGKVFRITSDNLDKQTPTVASFDFAQCSCTGWELPV